MVSAIIGNAIDVHRELVPGLSEHVYARACRGELDAQAIPYESEYPVPIRYKGKLLCHQRIDLLIDRRLALELKSVEAVHKVHIPKRRPICV